MMQHLKRNWIVNSKLTWGIWRILTRALENLKHLHFNRLLLTKAYNVWAKKKYRGVMLDDTEDWSKNLEKNWLVLSKMARRIWQIFVHRLKNSDFILESKMGKSNQNKNSKQPDRPDAGWKLYFILEINE